MATRSMLTKWLEARSARSWECENEMAEWSGKLQIEKKIERGMVKVRCNDFGWRPAVFFWEIQRHQKAFCWFCSLPLVCNLLFGLAIFWHHPTSKWRGLSDTNPKRPVIPIDLFWNMTAPVFVFYDNTTLSVSSYKENKWKVKSLMKGGWVCLVGSIIICGSVCCASVQSGYNHLLSLSFYIYPHLSISCSFLNGVRESVPCKEAEMHPSD